MKKAILIALIALTTFTVKAQPKYWKLSTDSLNQKLERINLRLEKFHDVHEMGTILHLAGVMTGGIAYTGYRFDYMDKKQMNNVLLIEAVLHVAGFTLQFYSHRFLVEPSKLSFKF